MPDDLVMTENGCLNSLSTSISDLDLIAPMAADGLAAAYVSITTLDAGLARVMESCCRTAPPLAHSGDAGQGGRAGGG